MPLFPLDFNAVRPAQRHDEPELAVADIVGRLMHFWGFKRPMGRVWTLLYLSPTPVSAADVGSKLKMSAGSISMALAELEKWGAVHRTWIPGDRRDFFSAEADIWKMVQRVFKERELALVREFTQCLKAAEAELGASAAPTSPHPADSTDSKDQRAIEYKRERLLQLRRLSEVGEKLLSGLVEGDAINPSAVLNSTSLPQAHE